QVPEAGDQPLRSGLLPRGGALPLAERQGSPDRGNRTAHASLRTAGGHHPDDVSDEPDRTERLNPAPGPPHELVARIQAANIAATAATDPRMPLRTPGCRYGPPDAATDPRLPLRTTGCRYGPPDAATDPRMPLRTPGCRYGPPDAARMNPR